MSGRTIGERLAFLRAGRSQEEAAVAVAVTRATWNRWERDRREPAVEDLRRIARVFGASLDWIVFGEGPTPSEHPTERPGSDLLPIDEDERIVLTSYRQLDKARQQVQLEQLQDLAKRAAREAREAKKRRNTPGKERRSA